MLVPIPNPNSSEEQFRKDTARIIAQLASTRLGENASPMFAGITITGLTASRLMATDSTKTLSSVTDLTLWVAGTANRITVADDGDGTITLSGPQDVHTGASPTFVAATLSGLTTSRLMATDGSKVTVSSDLVNWVAGTADEINVADDGDGTITIGLVDPLIVSKGGTGSALLTDHGILLGSGTGAITALGVATDGQIPIGTTGSDPVLAGITGTANQITVTNGAGSITLSTPQNIHTGASPTFAGLTLTDNITMPDGGTIGQAAGPLLTFDDTNDYLEITGCSVGVNTATPQCKCDVAGTIRATGSDAPASGAGIEFSYTGGIGYMFAYDRTGATYKPFALRGSTVDLRIATTSAIFVDASINVGITKSAGIAAQLHVDQSSGTGAEPVLLLDQADVSEEFIRFIGSAAAATLTQSIVDEGDVTTATLAGYIKVYVQDDGNQIADQAYYMPIYTLA